MAYSEEACTISCIYVFSLKNKTKHTNLVTFPSLAEKKNKTGAENLYPNDPL